MPKIKTNRGAAKRFRRTGKGYKMRRAFRNHILTKMTKKRKRNLRSANQVHENDVAMVARMLGDE